MENQEKLLQFVEWLGQNVPELKGQSPEQIVETVNKLSASEEGQQMLQGLIQEFESSTTGMFKKGGKLDYLLCLKKGGNIQDCGCGKKLSKKQSGGRVLGSDQYRHVSRGEAIKAAMDGGLTRSQARLAYRNQKNAMASNGFTGNEMKQHARWNMIDSVYPRAIEPVQRPEPIPTVSSISTPNAIAAPDAGIDTSRPASSTRPELLTFTNQNFDSAFGNARKMGLSEFGWNGGRYTTELDPGTPDAYETNPVDLSTPNPTVSGTTLPTSGWIAGPGYDPRVTQILKNEIANRRARRQ